MPYLWSKLLHVLNILQINCANCLYHIHLYQSLFITLCYIISVPQLTSLHTFQGLISMIPVFHTQYLCLSTSWECLGFDHMVQMLTYQ